MTVTVTEALASIDFYCDTVSADSDDVACVYRQVGFERAVTACIAEPAR